jgi:hypothetical protein
VPPKKTKSAKTKAEVLKDNAWKPGQSGNPKGRPKGALSLTSVIKEMGEWKAPPDLLSQYRAIFPQLPEEASCVQVLAARSLLKAMDLKAGDVMAKEIWERIDGKVPFPISGSGDGIPIPVKFDFKDLSNKELDIFERLLARIQDPD